MRVLLVTGGSCGLGADIAHLAPSPGWLTAPAEENIRRREPSMLA